MLSVEGLKAQLWSNKTAGEVFLAVKEYGLSEVHHRLVQNIDMSMLANFTHSAKLALGINQLVSNSWPNEKLKRKLYAGAVEVHLLVPTLSASKQVMIIPTRSSVTSFFRGSSHQEDIRQSRAARNRKQFLTDEILGFGRSDERDAGIFREVEGWTGSVGSLLCVVLNRMICTVDRGVHVRGRRILPQINIKVHCVFEPHLDEDVVCGRLSTIMRDTFLYGALKTQVYKLGTSPLSLTARFNSVVCVFRPPLLYLQSPPAFRVCGRSFLDGFMQRRHSALSCRKFQASSPFCVVDESPLSLITV